MKALFFETQWSHSILCDILIFQVLNHTGGKQVLFFFLRSFQWLPHDLSTSSVISASFLCSQLCLYWAASNSVSCYIFYAIIPKISLSILFLFSFVSFIYYFKLCRKEYRWHQKQCTHSFRCTVGQCSFSNKFQFFWTQWEDLFRASWCKSSTTSLKIVESTEVKASCRKSALKMSQLLKNENLVLCKHTTEHVLQVLWDSLTAYTYALKDFRNQKHFFNLVREPKVHSTVLNGTQFS